jgi:hypothetical protein
MPHLQYNAVFQGTGADPFTRGCVVFIRKQPVRSTCELYQYQLPE